MARSARYGTVRQMHARGASRGLAGQGRIMDVLYLLARTVLVKMLLGTVRVDVAHSH